MSFRQNIHIEEDVRDRINESWEFKPDRPTRNQNFAVLSVIAPFGTNQTTPSTFGVKLFGCFNTIDEANAYAKELQKQCDVFDYYVASLYEWIKLPPMVERLDDVHFREKELEELREKTIQMRESRAKIMQDRIRAKDPPQGRDGEAPQLVQAPPETETEEAGVVPPAALGPDAS
jgi:hypothetical protein